MTTLAIIGGGIAGRSLIYALAKKKKAYSKILVFESEDFAPKCSTRSTAIAAGRGVSTGHSDLGDLLIKGFEFFSKHVHDEKPIGIFPITQYTGATTKLDQFKLRYEKGSVSHHFGPLTFNQEIYLAEESAFLIDTNLYLAWLKEKSQALPLEWREEFVINYELGDESVTLFTNLHQSYQCDQIIFCGGAYNRFWGHPKTGRPIHGSYLEFHQIYFGTNSFSFTLDGDNIVYHAHSNKLLIGSTTEDLIHHLPNRPSLQEIYSRLQTVLSDKLPEFETGTIITGLREKASKRSPYHHVEGPIHWFGGLYKNAFNLSLHLATGIVDKLP